MRSVIPVALLTLFTSYSAIATAAGPTSTPASGEGIFTPSQEQRIDQMVENYLTTHPDKVGEMASEYLAGHPDFLIAASKTLQRQQLQAKQKALIPLAIQQQKALLDADGPSAGPRDAKTAVVLFFDYQCIYCSKIAPTVEALMKANPDVRFVFKEFPIFGTRWPVSGYAARVGLKIWKEKGSDAYVTYHNGLFATGHVEGKLTEDDVRKTAAPYLNKAQLDALVQNTQDTPEATAISGTFALANNMTITGTPAFVIMPQAAHPDAARVAVLPGGTSLQTLQAAVDNAAGTK